MTQASSIHQFCTYPARGGAGIAADRLVRGLLASGIETRLVGMNPEVQTDYILRATYRKGIRSGIHRRLRKLQLSRTGKGYAGISSSGACFFSDRSPNGMAMSAFFKSSGLLHFHWVCDFIDYIDTMRQVPEGIPLVWTLHDMGVFTGGCSYSLGCQRFEMNCGECPQLGAASAKRETRSSLERKARAIHEVKEQLTLICPSEWMAGMAGRSSLFKGIRQEVIRNGFDLEIFNPGKRDAGRQLMGCDSNEIVILFVAASLENPIKGMRTIIESLGQVRDPKTRICYLGDKGGTRFPADWQWMGQLHDEEKLAKLYAGSDLLVVPSEADNYPNVICEALACGLPVIASRTGGIPELVVNEETGYLFERGDSDDLLKRINLMTGSLPRTRENWSSCCRKFAEATFEIKQITREHVALYESLGWDQAVP